MGYFLTNMKVYNGIYTIRGSYGILNMNIWCFFQTCFSGFHSEGLLGVSGQFNGRLKHNTSWLYIRRASLTVKRFIHGWESWFAIHQKKTHPKEKKYYHQAASPTIRLNHLPSGWNPYHQVESPTIRLNHLPSGCITYHQVETPTPEHPWTKKKPISKINLERTNALKPHKKKPGWLGYIGIILPSYIGIIINHYKL